MIKDSAQKLRASVCSACPVWRNNCIGVRGKIGTSLAFFALCVDQVATRGMALTASSNASGAIRCSMTEGWVSTVTRSAFSP